MKPAAMAATTATPIPIGPVIKVTAVPTAGAIAITAESPSSRPPAPSMTSAALPTFSISLGWASAKWRSQVAASVAFSATPIMAGKKTKPIACDSVSVDFCVSSRASFQSSPSLPSASVMTRPNSAARSAYCRKAGRPLIKQRNQINSLFARKSPGPSAAFFVPRPPSPQRRPPTRESASSMVLDLTRGIHHRHAEGVERIRVRCDTLRSLESSPR